MSIYIKYNQQLHRILRDTIIIDTTSVAIDSTRKCLKLARQYSIGDSAFIKIANLAIDILIFGAIKGLQTGPCTTLGYIDSLQFDEINYFAEDKQIITLKK